MQQILQCPTSYNKLQQRNAINCGHWTAASAGFTQYHLRAQHLRKQDTQAHDGVHKMHAVNAKTGGLDAEVDSPWPQVSQLDMACYGTADADEHIEMLMMMQ